MTDLRCKSVAYTQAELRALQKRRDPINPPTMAWYVLTPAGQWSIEEHQNPLCFQVVWPGSDVPESGCRSQRSALDLVRRETQAMLDEVRGRS